MNKFQSCFVLGVVVGNFRTFRKSSGLQKLTSLRLQFGNRDGSSII